MDDYESFIFFSSEWCLTNVVEGPWFAIPTPVKYENEKAKAMN